MTDPLVVIINRVLRMWRHGEDSHEIAATVEMSEQQVLKIIWAERAERLRAQRHTVFRRAGF